MMKMNTRVGKRILSACLILAMLISMTPAHVIPEAEAVEVSNVVTDPGFKVEMTKKEMVEDLDGATVTTYTGGKVSYDDDNNVTVVIEETELNWVEANELRAEGWWVGIDVVAPEGFSENASYKVKTNPKAEYGEAKLFKDYKDSENDIQLWYPVSPDSLEKFAAENRNLIMTYAFDWNANGEYEQTIVFSVVPSSKIVLKKDGQVANNQYGYGKVTTYTGGTITGNESAYVEVIVEETEITKVEGNALRPEGWWVGIDMIAPAGFNAEKASYKVKNNPAGEYGEVKLFDTYKDSPNDIQLWYPISPEALTSFAGAGYILTMTYAFDWDGNGVYEQTIVFSVVPNSKIVLKDLDGTQVYPESTAYGSVSTYTGGTVIGNETANTAVKVEQTTLQWMDENTPSGEGWWVGIDVVAPEGYSEDATFQIKKNADEEYGEKMSFAQYKDGEKDVQLWFKVTPEILEEFAAKGSDVTRIYGFDWDNNDAIDQTIVFSVVPSDDIVLMKDGQQAVVEHKQYRYDLKVTYGGNEISDYTAYWADDAQSSRVTSGASGSSYVSEAESATVTVNYNGLYLTLTSENGSAQWSAKAAANWGNLVKVGVPFEVSAPVIASGCGTDLSWKLSSANLDAAYTDDNADMKVAAQVPGNGEALLTYNLENNGSTVVAVAYTPSVEMCDFSENTVSFWIGSNVLDETWYAAPQNVTVKIASDVYDQKYLPAIEGHADAQWSYMDGSWSTTVENVAGKIKVGDIEKTVNVDSEEPVISALKAYVGDDGKVYVSFEVTANSSGVSKVYINDVEYAGDTRSAVLDSAETVAVYAANGANVNGAKATITPQAALSLNVSTAQTVGTVDKTVYFDGSSEIKISFANTDNGDYAVKAEDVTVTDKDGNSLQVSWSAEMVGSVKLAAGQDVKGIKVFATDATGRTVSYANTEVVYYFDDEAPVIEISAAKSDDAEPKINDGITYYDKDVSYTVTVEDAYMGNGQVFVKYTVNGQQQTAVAAADGSYTITVIDGQKLESIDVTAVDATGNNAEKTVTPNVVVDYTAPVVTFAIDEHVKGFVYNNDKCYAILDSVEINGEDATDAAGVVTVAVTATVADANMANPGDWTMNEDGSYSKVLEVTVAKNTMGELPISIAIEDLAGNKPVQDADIAVNPASPICDLTLTDGVYTGSVFVDRRTPSTGADDQVPVIELTPDKTTEVADAYNSSVTFSMIVSDNGSGIQEVSYTLDDGLNGEFLKAGQLSLENGVYTIPVEILEGVVNETDDVVIRIVVADKVGNEYRYAKTITVDNKAPEMTLSHNEDVVVLDNGIELFAQGFAYQMMPSDVSLITLVDWKLNDGLGGVFLNPAGGKVNADGSYTLNVNVSGNAQNESNDVVYTIVLGDILGNKKTYEQHLAVDNLAPRVTVSYDNNEAGAHFDSQRVATITVEDINFNADGTVISAEGTTPAGEPIVIAGTDWAQNGNVWTTTRTFTEEGDYTFAMTCKDKTENVSVIDLTNRGSNTAADAFTVDNTNPVMTVTKTVETGKAYVQSDAAADYYSGRVTYSFQMTDNYLGAEDYVGQVTYMLEDGTKADLYLNAANDYTVAFTLNNGDVLTGLSFVAVDNAGRVCQVNGTDVIVVDSNGTTSFEASAEDPSRWVYTGKNVAVDSTDPEITVSKTVDEGTDYIQSANGADFYNGAVTYTVEVTDKFLTALDKSKAELKLTYENESMNQVINLFEQNPSVSDIGGQDTYSWSFIVHNSQVLTGMSIELVDNAGNVAKSVNVVDADEKTAFAYSNNVNAYNANAVAVDTMAPFLTVSKSIADGAMFTKTNGGVDYYNGAVTYTIQVNDLFLNADALSAKAIYSDGSTDVVTMTAEATNTKHSEKDVYTGSFTVTDAKDLVDIVLSIEDYALHTVTRSDLKVIDAENKTGFEISGKTLSYNGNKVVADTVAPVVSIDVSDNVEYFYTDASGNVFAVLAPSVIEQAAQQGQKVTVSFTAMVEDKNLNVDALSGWNVSGDKKSATKTFETEVLAHQSAMVEILIDVIDYALWVPTAELVATANNGEAKDNFVNSQIIPLENGDYALQINVDRRSPSSTEGQELPEIILNLPADLTPDRSTNGLELFHESFDYTMQISDASQNGYDSGVKSVTWTLDDGLGGTYLETSVGEAVNGVYTVPVAIQSGAVNESNDVKLTITVEDNVGNKYTYTKTIAVDNKAPRVTVSYDNNDEGMYFNAQRIATVTVEDINFNADATVITTEGKTPEGEAIEIAGTDWSQDGIVYTATRTFAAEGEYTFSMTCKDLATNESVIDIANGGLNTAPGKFVVDLTNPVVTITKTVAEDKAYIQSDDTTDFYNGEVTYTFQTVDHYLSAEDYVGIVNYTLESGATFALEMNAQNDYTVSFTLKDNDVLTALNFTVVDNSGRVCETYGKDVVVVDADNNTSFAAVEGTHGLWNYTGKKVAVDSTDPVISVHKSTGNLVQSVGSVDYYNNAVTYTVYVEDNFLTNLQDSTAQVSLTYQDAAQNKTINLFEDEKATISAVSGKDCYSCSFTVENPNSLTGMTIELVDNAGNIAKSVNVNDTENKTSFAYNNGINTYTGNQVVVDTVNPKVEVSVTGNNVDSFYTYNGVVYVTLKNPGNAMSGELTGQAAETVTLTVTATDKNLTIDPKIKHAVVTNLEGDESAWSGSVAINADSTVTYTKSITVNSDDAGVFKFDLSVFDLAGHAVTAEDTTVKALDNGSTPFDNNKLVAQGSNGRFGGTISLDRRRPSSVNDQTAPKIEINPSIAFTQTENGMELFNGAFNFAMTVTDGEDNQINSGLAMVQWDIADPVGFVSGHAKYELASGVFTENYSIPVSITEQANESNSVELTITAVDKVGNTTIYTKQFAVDNLAPRVTVSYDNNSALNEKYFKADRVVTITVEDINFNAETTSVPTQGIAPDGSVITIADAGWARNGDVYTTTRTYNTDGVYTLAMTTTDRANNVVSNDAGIDMTNGGVNVAPMEFILDKTAPVITVTYNPDGSVDKDASGVLYFDKNRQVTVAIEEVNFKADEVISNLGANNALSAFVTREYIHTANETFTKGNNYSVSVAYTDLAGNEAVPYESPKFSVDEGAPTITISKGTMTNSTPNFVQDELSLGFTINDAEDNLKDFSITVQHTDTNFQTKLVEGEDYYTVSGKGDRTTGYIEFANIAKDKANDGVYVVRITAEDYAGHVVELAPQLVFSLNRFGSSFTVSDSATAQFLTPSDDGVVYRQSVDGDIVIQEINPSRVYQDEDMEIEGSLITITVNGTSQQLQEGGEYTLTVTEEGTEGNKWYVYTYAIHADNFYNGDNLINGRYSISLYGVDEAGNKNTNESNFGSSVQVDTTGEPTGKLQFVLDDQAPIVSLIGVENGKTYDVDNQKVIIDISDNTGISIEVYLDDVKIELSDAEDTLSDSANWLVYDETTGQYTLNVAKLNKPRNLRVVTTDAAGNVTESTVEGFLVTAEWFFQYIYNTWAVAGTIVGLIALVTVLIVLIRKKKKDGEEETI